MYLKYAKDTVSKNPVGLGISKAVRNTDSKLDWGRAIESSQTQHYGR